MARERTAPIEPESIPGVLDVELVAGPGFCGGRAPDLLVEVPHGATLERHFDALRRRLRGSFRDDLREFFFVNTDVGAPEFARHVAHAFVEPQAEPGARPRAALVLRGLLPRTFVDCNRVLGESGPRLMTPAIPDYVADDEDRRLLADLHGQYSAATVRAFDAVCGSGGRALIVHSYAPVSVRIETIDETIVDQLHAAYGPELFSTWPRRPPIDLITESDERELLAPSTLVAAVLRNFERAGVAAECNATYRLHADSVGYVHAARHRGRVLCMELSRELVADPFTPFREMRISPEAVRRLALPVAAALLEAAPPDDPRGAASGDVC